MYLEQKKHFLHFLRELIPLIHSKKRKRIHLKYLNMM